MSNYYYTPQLFKMPSALVKPSPPLVSSLYAVGATPDTSKMLLLAGAALALWFLVKR